ncbi:MAG: hypothetical protein H6846_11955 [Hyphomonas sp.]|nr:hypothetical protein [Hyphomonas sp.]
MGRPRAVQELGLDFAAVDYSIRPDGGPILWEANPYFYLPAGQASVLSTGSVMPSNG